MRLSYEPATQTNSPTSFGLAESIDSGETYGSSSLESSKFSDFFSSSSSSSSSSLPSSSSQSIDNFSSSTTSNLWSTIFTPSTLSSTSLSISTPATLPTTISSVLSSFSSSPSTTIEPLISESSAPVDHYYPHHAHHHPVTPSTATLPTRIIDFGDRFVREEQRCVALVPESYDPLTSTLCGLAVFIGLIYILAGYRLFRSTLFLTGFLISSTLIYTLIGLTSSPIPLLGTLVVSLSVGLLTGLITFLVAWIGLFCLGFNLGTFIGTLIIISIHLLSPHVDTLSPPQSIWVTFSVIAGWGIIGAFSTLYFQKGCTILATCMFGSAFVIAGLDYFVENFNLFNWFWENLRTDGNGYVTLNGSDDSGLFMCLISWILLMLWAILVSLGLFCQWCATGRGYYHSGTLTSTSSSRRNGTLDLVKIRAEESKTEQKQRKYRYLYQVRTAHGDVISQHYIQNFQKKLSPQMDHNDSLRTYNSDLSHLTSYNQSESRTTTMSHLP